MHRPPVLLLKRILPPYRVALVEALSRSPHFDITVAYGQPTAGSALVNTVDLNAVTVTLRNVCPLGGERLVYQHGWFELVSSGRFNVVIAEFNPRIVSNLLALRLVKRRGDAFIWWGHGLSPKHAPEHWVSGWRLKLERRSDAVIFYERAQSELFGIVREPRAC